MRSKTKISAEIILILLILQATITTIFLLSDPSEADRAVFGGYSNVKLLMIGSALLILLVMITLFVSYRIKPKWFVWIKNLAKKICASKLGATVLVLSLGASILLFAAALATIALKFIGGTVSLTLLLIFINALPLILLFLVLNLEFFLIIKNRWHCQINLPNYSRLLTIGIRSKPFGWIWALLILLLSISHWLIIIFQWPIFQKIPLWYWQTTTKWGFRSWLIVPMVVLYFTGFWIIHKKSQSTLLKFGIILFVGITLIIGFAAMEGSPYQVLYDKRLISGHRDYIAVAARNTGGSLFLYDYDQALGQNRFFATKPPGVYLLYRGLLFIGDIIFPTGTYQENYDAINHTSMILFPLLSIVTIFVVRKLTSILSAIDPPEPPAYLLLIIPNFLLLQVTIDQAVIPLLASSFLLLGIAAYQRKKPIQALLFGITIYLGLYFSFSLLPLILILGLWIILELARNYDTKRLRQSLQFIGYALGGFALMIVSFYLIFHYLPWERYFAAMSIHEIQRAAPIGIRAHLNMYLLNNLEFATWIGFPLAVTALLAIFSSTINFLWKKWTSLDSLILATFSAYLFVNFFGNTLSEVGRLWIFFVPFICIFVIDFIQEKMSKRYVVIILFILQFITAFQVVKNILITWE